MIKGLKTGHLFIVVDVFYLVQYRVIVKVDTKHSSNFLRILKYVNNNFALLSLLYCMFNLILNSFHITLLYVHSNSKLYSYYSIV